MPFAIVAAAVLAQADKDKPFVDPLFTDNMVLQRDMADPIWGWATPGEKVTVALDGKTFTTMTDPTGRWSTKLPKYKAGGSYTLTVYGPSSATFTNVTFGDVWVCSGQSNMEFGVGNLANPKAEIDAADYPNIRLYRVPKLISATPVGWIKSDWQICTPKSLATDGDWNGFSAVGYFFGRKLHQDLKVPIGLIHTSWGGTIAEAWASQQRLAKTNPEFNSQIADIARNAASPVPFAQRLNEWYAKNDAGSTASPAWSAADLSDGDWTTLKVPGFFQKAGIPEFNNHASVVWLRTTVQLPTDTDLDGATINFTADDNDSTWINGTAVGASDGWDVKRAYAIPAGLLKAGANSIVVRVTDTFEPGGIYDNGYSPCLKLKGGQTFPLAGDWKARVGAKITDKNPMPAWIGDNPNQPTVLYNGMVSPLGPFAIKGAIWYQGESNVGRAKQYQTLLPTMIESWRDQFGVGAFPFFIVQLAGFMHPPVQPGEDGWAELREAQMIASTTCPNAGIATAIDIGEQNDIHPKNKQEVGRRLALVAEAKVYRQRIEFAGPTYKRFKVEGGNIRISFDHAAGLKTADGQAPRGFAIAGEDRKWHWADAKIDGKSVVVSCADVAKPVAVRYAWAAFFDVNLQNGDGLPAFPFRTDSPATK